MQFFILTGIKSMSRKYERKNKKNYHQWVLDHKTEILELPSKQRTDYVMGKLNDELNLNMQRYNVYQLLYRNGLINHKHDKPIPTPVVAPEVAVNEMDTSTTIPETMLDDDGNVVSISLGPCNEEYLSRRIYEMFGVICNDNDDLYPDCD